MRVFERFSTLDTVSSGARRSFWDAGPLPIVPLFGYDLSRYDELFEDKLSLFAELLKGGPVTWSGHARGGFRRVGLSADRKREARPGLAWGEPGIGGARGTLRSAVDARDHRRQSRAFRPFVDLYRQALEKLGQPMLPVAVHSPGYVAATDERARNGSGRTTKR